MWNLSNFGKYLQMTILCLHIFLIFFVVAALTESELEQLSCPGCKDRFLLPTSFYQHIYRKSARIHFDCIPCGKWNTFFNKCHLRTHILSHLEVDGIQSVSIPGPQSLEVGPLEPSELDIG